MNFFRNIVKLPGKVYIIDQTFYRNGSCDPIDDHLNELSFEKPNGPEGDFDYSMDTIEAVDDGNSRCSQALTNQELLRLAQDLCDANNLSHSTCVRKSSFTLIS